MSSPIIDPARYGVSFSVKQCRAFGVNTTEALEWLLQEAGFRRFRLMSYWNEIEKEQGTYDFAELDQQIAQIKAVGGVISLCLGLKQPRWPEYHWPTWAKELLPDHLEKALLQFITAVVARYKDDTHVISWQLENEALLKGFGLDIQIDRKRLRTEYALVKKLDPSRPIIMSTSNGWGIPLREPIPDIVGFSYYAVMYQNGEYRRTIHRPWLYKLRKRLITLTSQRPVFIHELQLEPWGHTAIWKMTFEEQDRSMSPRQIAANLQAAQKIGACPIDLWGAEWWYWRLRKHHDPTIWRAVQQNLR